MAIVRAGNSLDNRIIMLPVLENNTAITVPHADAESSLQYAGEYGAVCSSAGTV